jgi:hypothetical protein
METMKARFVRGEEGEEHEVNVLPMWEEKHPTSTIECLMMPL